MTVTAVTKVAGTGCFRVIGSWWMIDLPNTFSLSQKASGVQPTDKSSWRYTRTLGILLSIVSTNILSSFCSEWTFPWEEGLVGRGLGQKGFKAALDAHQSSTWHGKPTCLIPFSCLFLASYNFGMASAPCAWCCLDNGVFLSCDHLSGDPIFFAKPRVAENTSQRVTTCLRKLS